MNYYFRGSVTHSDVCACLRFAIHYSKERLYILLQCKFLRYKVENICFKKFKKKYLKLLLLGSICWWLNSYCNHLTLLLDHTLQWMESITRFYFSQNHSWKVLWLPFSSSQCIIRRRSKGQKYWWKVNTVRGTSWVTDLATMLETLINPHFQDFCKPWLHSLSL